MAILAMENDRKLLNEQNKIKATTPKIHHIMINLPRLKTILERRQKDARTVLQKQDDSRFILAGYK